jgi:hypothetical protein
MHIPPRVDGNERCIKQKDRINEMKLDFRKRNPVNLVNPV